MTTNLLHSGGPPHDLAATSARLAETLAPDDVESFVVDDLHEAFERLVDPRATWDLVTVNALRWQMGAERYADLRDEWSFTLRDDEAEALAGHVRRGGGLLAMHTAIVCFDGHPAWHSIVGASWDWDRSSHPPVAEVTVTVTEAGRRHPITEGLESFSVVDEVYGFLDEEPDLVALLTGDHGGRAHPLLWARQVGEGRVVTSLLGHSVEACAHPANACILRRGARWALGEEGRR